MLTITEETLKSVLTRHYTGAFEFQRRRHSDWTENYQLYRDRVITNRLTQRQSVNAPLMKETIRTVLSRVDDPPNLEYEEESNDKDKELLVNAYWDKFTERAKIEVKDIVDKKQVLMTGISTKKIVFDNGLPNVDIIDSFNILYGRFTDPADYDSAQYVCHQGIKRTIGQMLENPAYDKDAVARVKSNYELAQGLVADPEQEKARQEANERLESMGDVQAASPDLGEAEFEIKEHYIKLLNEDEEREEFFLLTECAGETLRFDALEDVIGETRDHFWRYNHPFITWTDDTEKVDIYPDGVADTVRPTNKIFNALYSQLLENRALRNLGMMFYDSKADENFVPQTFDPQPFGWYPLPGKPSEVMQRVDILDLTESIDEMGMLKKMIESATAATATEKGTQEKANATLGEIQLINAKALERISSMSKHYTKAWQSFGLKWLRFCEGMKDELDPITVSKKSYKGNYFEKTISPAEIFTGSYNCKVTTSSEQEASSVQTIQKYQAVKGEFVSNPAFNRLYKRKLLDFLKPSPDEVREIMDAEEQAATLVPPTAPTPGSTTGTPSLTPQLTPARVPAPAYA